MPGRGEPRLGGRHNGRRNVPRSTVTTRACEGRDLKPGTARATRTGFIGARLSRACPIGGCGACQAPAAVPKLPPRSARKGLAGNIPSNPANRWGPRLRGCTGGVCMYYVPLFREVLYIRYGTPLPLRESASTTIRGYRFPAEHRNSGTRTLSERQNQESDQAASSEPLLHARRLLLNRPTPTQPTSARCTSSKHTTDQHS